MRARPERRPQLGLVERPVRLAQQHRPHDRAGEDRVRPVVLVPGLEQHDLVAGVQQRERHRDQGLGGPAGDAHLGVGIDRPARVRPRGLLRDRGPQRGGAERHRVLVVVGVDRGARGRLQLRRAREVGEALAEVDRAVLGGEPERLPDHRLGELGRLRAGPHPSTLPPPPSRRTDRSALAGRSGVRSAGPRSRYRRRAGAGGPAPPSPPSRPARLRPPAQQGRPLAHAHQPQPGAVRHGPVPGQHTAVAHLDDHLAAAGAAPAAASRTARRGAARW